MFQYCVTVPKIVRFLQHNKFGVALVSFMTSEVLEYGQVEFHIIPQNNHG